MSARLRGWVILAAAAVLLPWTVWQGVAGCAEAGDDNVSGCPTARPYCGDRCVDSSLAETCDDGNRIAGDGCDPSCHREGVVDAGDTTPPVDDAGTPDDTVTTPDETVTPEDTARPEDTWIPETTDTGSCPESPCRLWPQCGCPAGEKCTIDPASTETSLIKVCTTAGSGTITSSCTAEEDCSAGTACFALYTAEATPTMAMCNQFCAAQTDCTGAGAYCLPLTTSASFPGACSHACNLATSSGCASGSKCGLYLYGTSDTLTDCTSDVGSSAAGGYCVAEADCASGTFCATEISQCIGYCNNPGGACSGGTCNSFDPPAFVGTTEWGYCY